MKPQFQRKKVLVNRRVQGRVLLRVLWLWALYHVILWHMMLFFRFVQYSAELLTGGAPRPFSDISAEFFENHYLMLVCAVIVLPYLVWDVLKVTHRFVGPLVQFQRCLASLARGEQVAEVKLRQGDFLGELRDSFNEFLHSPYAPGQDPEPARPPVSESAVTISTGDEADVVKADVENILEAIHAEVVPVEHVPASR
jgi:hypothetical protein